MPNPTPERDSIPFELLTTPDLLAAISGRFNARLVADRSLPELADASHEELLEAGMSDSGAERLVCALELGRRLSHAPLRHGEQFKTSDQIFRAYDPQLRHLKKERFICVLLDARSRVVREVMVTEGILTASLVHPREVFAPAIRHAAASIVLVHNHPSLDPEPSPEDVEITRRLAAVGELVGIRVTDHVVLGGGRYVSFLERGLVLA